MARDTHFPVIAIQYCSWHPLVEHTTFLPRPTVHPCKIRLHSCGNGAKTIENTTYVRPRVRVTEDNRRINAPGTRWAMVMAVRVAPTSKATTSLSVEPVYSLSDGSSTKVLERNFKLSNISPTGLKRRVDEWASGRPTRMIAERIHVIAEPQTTTTRAVNVVGRLSKTRSIAQVSV